MIGELTVIRARCIQDGVDDEDVEEEDVFGVTVVVADFNAVQN
jgi:hypothetical protein